MKQAATTPTRTWLVAIALACAAALYIADTPGAQAVPECPNAGTPSSQLSQAQARKAVRCLINEERGSRRPLRLNRALNRAAARHSRTMRDHVCFRHACPGEPATIGARLRDYLQGAQKTRYAEVIALNAAAAPPRVVVNQWITSAPHRELILGRFKHLGVGFAVDTRQAWWTVELGFKR